MSTGRWDKGKEKEDGGKKGRERWLKAFRTKRKQLRLDNVQIFEQKKLNQWLLERFLACLKNFDTDSFTKTTNNSRSMGQYKFDQNKWMQTDI